jgi:hypothetical protein
MVACPRFEPTPSAAPITRVARMETSFATDRQAKPRPARAMAISQARLGHLLMPRRPDRGCRLEHTCQRRAY